MPGILYIVATPIGNLEDMTFRAVRVLKDVDLIAAEDTRHTQVLLNRFEIGTALTSYHQHNERTKARQLVARLKRGASIALVSDAGTPAISDPGYRLVVEALDAGIRVIPVPGPSALTAVLSAGGLPTNEFVFAGFLPAKKQERRSKLRELRDEHRSMVMHEAPHRLKECLDDLHDVLGDRRIVVAREVTKVHEEFIRGCVSQVIEELAAKEVRGEITLVVEGSSQDTAVSEEALRDEIATLQAGGKRVKEIAEILGEKFGYSKKEIYRLVLDQSEEGRR
jgi:16S rRNA (cytidine1402-2'-O)-methyltransferase